MDPGVDDALAIILALRTSEAAVQAITICGGNTGLEQCAANALKAARVAIGQPTPPVAQGAMRPLRRSPFRAGGIHGPDGLGNVRDRYPDPGMAELDPRDAVDVILQVARAHPDVRAPETASGTALTIVATGPLTNLAHAISKDPESIRRVERILWMGGAFGVCGNISPVAEFNAFCDPDAAAEVLAFGVPMTVVGLDACLQCPLMRSDLRTLKESHDTPQVRFAWDICQMYMDFYQQAEEHDGCYLHDPLAVGLALWPELATRTEAHHVQVVTEPGPAWGMTIIDRRPRNPWLNPISRAVLERIPEDATTTLQGFGVMTAPPHIDVVFQVDTDAFLRRFTQSLC